MKSKTPRTAAKAPRAEKKVVSAQAVAKAVAVAVKTASVQPDVKPAKGPKLVNPAKGREPESKRVATMPPDAYSRVPVDVKDAVTRERIALSIPRLRAALAIAPKDSPKQTRRYLCGVHLRVVDANLHIVATDGNQMMIAYMTSEKGWPDFLRGKGITLSRDALAECMGFLAKFSKGSSDQVVLEYAAGAPGAWLASMDNQARFQLPVKDDEYPDYAAAMEMATRAVLGGETQPLNSDSGIAREFVKGSGVIAQLLDSKAVKVIAPIDDKQGWIITYDGVPALVHVIMQMRTEQMDVRTLPMLGSSNLKGTLAALRATVTMKERAVKESEGDQRTQKRHQEVLDSVRARITLVEEALKAMAPQLEDKSKGKAKGAKKAKAVKEPKAPAEVTPPAPAPTAKDVH